MNIFKKLTQETHLERHSALDVDEEKRENFFLSTWKTFARNTSMHGVRYISETSFHIMERSLWALLILLALSGMIYSSLLLSARFQASKTSTVFESTDFKVSEISFAALTLCNNNRVNLNKTEAAIKYFIPNRNETDRKTFTKFIHVLQNLEFGSFDEFAVIEMVDVTFLDHLNISHIYEFLMHDCEEFFVQCVWRDKPLNCCELFTKQRSMYGICWSFNSLTNAGNNFVNRSDHYPWRTPSGGFESGLKVIVNTHPETSIDRSEIANSSPGLMIVVSNPNEWPQNSLFLGGGSMTALQIAPTAFSTSDELRSLKPIDRQCNYNTETDELDLMSLQGIPYMRANCISECQQRYTMKFCGCSVGLMFPAKGYPECNVSSLICLIKHNDFLNGVKPQVTNEFFDENYEGMDCPCLPECSRVAYNFEVSPIYDQKKIKSNFVLVNVYFGKSTMLKYRTDVTFSALDLLVGFGGVVSLFLGGSLLSAAEVIYFSTIALFWHHRRDKMMRLRLVQKIKAQFPFLN